MGLTSRLWGSSSAITDTHFLKPSEELAALQEASMQAAWVMNDEIKRAEDSLSKGTSAFHKLGYGATLFWQSVLGFDKDMMARASAALADAESVSTEHLKRVLKDPSTAHHSEIYTPGAEYALCQVQSQLLGAILGVLKESWMEGLAGLNKLRRAYFTLHGMVEAEKKYLERHPAPASRRNSDDSLAFEDAVEYQPVREQKGPGFLINGIPNGSEAKRPTAGTGLRRATSDPIDLYIHSGVSMSWGIINVVLSLVPPLFRYLLAKFSFKGDREYGLSLLWTATTYKENIFGAIAGLVTLLYNNVAISLADILPSDAVPERQLRQLLRELRKLYPDSKLWLIEESRMAVVDRDLEEAVRILESGGSSFKQLQGLCIFEKALDLMFLHRFEDCAGAFMKCIEFNSWSHGMYRFIAAACHIELYRDIQASNPTKAKEHADKAKELLKPVPVLARKKAIMGKQLPFDSFIATKLDKWEARSKARNCDLIDAVGISPIEELSYFWTGYRRMSTEHLNVSLKRLTQCEASPEWNNETVDERAGLALLQAIVLRCLGQTNEAKLRLKKDVLCYTSAQIKACPYAVTYPLPVAHYELAVCLWQEADKNKLALQQCEQEVNTAYKWESYDLEERMTVKIAAARETLRKCAAA